MSFRIKVSELGVPSGTYQFPLTGLGDDWVSDAR